MNISTTPENQICITSSKTTIDNPHQIVLARIDPLSIKALILKYDKKVSEAGDVSGIAFKHFWMGSVSSRINHQEAVYSLLYRVENTLYSMYGNLPKISFSLSTIEIDKDNFIHLLLRLVRSAKS